MAKPKRSDGHTIHNTPKPPRNYCFVCGKDNLQGMRLKFYLDEEARQAICKFKLTRRYTGPPGHTHGGIIAAILDDAMGKVNKFRRVIALTREMKVEYLRPVPLGQTLTVVGREESVVGRKHTNVAEISNAQGTVLARSTGIFIAVDMTRMFGKIAPAVRPATVTPQEKQT